MTHSRRSLTLFALLVLALAAAAAAEDAAQPFVDIDRWLVLGPFDVPMPAFHAGDDGDDFDVTKLLDTDNLDPAMDWPRAGDPVRWPLGPELHWREAEAGKTGVALAVDEDGGAVPRGAYLAAYLETPRFSSVELVLHSHHLLRVWLDGTLLDSKTTSEGAPPAEGEKTGKAKKGKARAEAEAGRLSVKLELTPGKHLVLVHALRDPAGQTTWTVDGEVTGENAPRVVASPSPSHALRLAELLDVETLNGLHLSPDGELVAIELARPAVPAEHRERWIEIRRTADGTAVARLEGGVSDFSWLADGRYAYLTTEDDGASLWIAELGGGARRVLEGVDGLGTYQVTDDGASVIYVVHEPEKDDERGVHRLRAIADRWSYFRGRDHLYQASTADGTRRRLSVGRLRDGLLDVRGDGKKLLFSRTRDAGVTVRPYSEDELWELDLETLEPRLIRRMGWLGAASYSPDGRRLLVLSSPAAFDGIGRNLPEGAIVNDYDTQAYLLDLATGAADPITRDYDPSILSGRWSHADGRIVFRVQEGSSARLVRFDPESRTFTPIKTTPEVVDSFSLARNADVIVYDGSSAARPDAVWSRRGGLDGDGAEVTVRVPSEREYEDVVLGQVEPWSFTKDDGTRIEGRIHYPPGFDPARKYPLLVYYYGGTAPVDREFGGRYPKALWSAHGYVVYVLQPSGATGYGQAFSARHVNDWGRTTADEIIDGTRRFLDAHPFVDPARVGCLGASYGGFMTMLLVTRTDLYAAALAHAGISDLASYWGEGWWGYSYSAVASAESFPWNHPELYVEQSPLFSADKIHTPLLLLHGTADTNVPVGESRQLYTALQLLGREVELIEIAGQDHWILDYPKRKLWAETILAWFEKTLKGEPEYWEHLWGTDAKPKG